MKPNQCIIAVKFGILQFSCLFDRGTFWVLPLTYLYLPKSAGAYLFPQSLKIHYFCSGPVSVRSGNLSKFITINSQNSLKILSKYIFPQSLKIHYFCSGPITVDFRNFIVFFGAETLAH